MFEPISNRVNVDHVQISVVETVGVEGRGGFYEEAGALREMVQSHMLQLVSLVGMEAPVSLDADSIRDEKVKLLHAVRTPTVEAALASAARAAAGGGREDEVEEPWRICTAILDAWAQARRTSRQLPGCAAGTWGPAEADELLARDGREWCNPVQPSRGAVARS